MIVRPRSGTEIAPEVLGDAALIAAHFSGGKPDGAYDVDYTQVKYVRMLPKEVGRFMLAKRRTLRVAVESDRLRALLGGSLPR